RPGAGRALPGQPFSPLEVQHRPAQDDADMVPRLIRLESIIDIPAYGQGAPSPMILRRLRRILMVDRAKRCGQAPRLLWYSGIDKITHARTLSLSTCCSQIELVEWYRRSGTDLELRLPGC